MTLQPINAIVYNQNEVDIKDVIAPPYDVIDSDYQNDLYARSPYNIVRLILSKAENLYEDSKKSFQDWKNKNILIKTKKPTIFYIIQKYKDEKAMIDSELMTQKIEALEKIRIEKIKKEHQEMKNILNTFEDSIYKEELEVLIESL